MTGFEVGMSISMGLMTLFGLGVSVRRLEKNSMDRANEEKQRRDDKDKAVQDKFASLELTVSTQRSDMINILKEFDKLRQGAVAMELRLEHKVDDNVRVVERAAGEVETIMKLVKVNKNADKA